MKELLLKMIGSKEMFSDKEKLESFIEKKRYERKYKFPSFKFKSDVSNFNINDCDVYKFLNNNSNKVIVYLHGGAYINNPSFFHLKYVDKLVQESNMDVYFPIYPLAPNHDYSETYDLLFNLYNKLLNENKEVILMGDSAGGGLALAFTQYLNKLKIKLPFKLILISPWVDVSMTNPDILKYEGVDPVLSSYGLVEIAKLWAGKLDLKNYKISPLYGEFNSLPDTLLFVGERELLYPDICLLHDKMKENGVDIEFAIGENMNHNYPLHPFKESKKAQEKIIYYLNNLN